MTPESTEIGREASSDAAASDQALIAACQRGSEAAWKRLVLRYQHLVYSVARRHRLDQDDVGEVFDGVFAELWRSLDQMEQPERLRAWLVTVTRRHSLAQLQYRRRWVNFSSLEASVGGETHDPTPASEAVLLEAEREQKMRLALARLSPRCRRVLEWLFFSDPPPAYEEIGRRLGLASNSIGFVRGRCLRKLRQAWEENE